MDPMANKPTDAQNTGYAPAGSAGLGQTQQDADVKSGASAADGGYVNKTSAANGHGFGTYDSPDNGTGGAPGTHSNHAGIVPSNDGDGDDKAMIP